MDWCGTSQHINHVTYGKLFPGRSIKICEVQKVTGHIVELDQNQVRSSQVKESIRLVAAKVAVEHNPGSACSCSVDIIPYSSYSRFKFLILVLVCLFPDSHTQAFEPLASEILRLLFQPAISMARIDG